MSEKKQVRGGRFARIEESATHRAVARSLFEGKAGRTCADVAKEMGLAESTVRRWKSEADKAGAPWRVQRRKLPELNGLAAKIADQHRVTLAEMGPRPTDEQKQEAERRTADLVAAEARAEVITKHRLEWQIVRRTLYEAIKTGDRDKARMAKDTADAIELMQKSERRAWGLDNVAFGPSSEGTTVIVERVSGETQDRLNAGDDSE